MAATIRENQWALPLIGAIGGIMLGIALFDVDDTPADGWTITVSQARTTLAGLVALMFTILSLSLSLTTIALDNVSSHFSLRMLTVAVHDYRTKIATSVFALAVTFIGVELFKLTDFGADELTPRTPFAVAVLLIVGSGIALFWQLNYTIQSLRLDRSLSRLHRVIHRSAAADERRCRRWTRAGRPDVGDAVPVVADRSGYVTDLDLEGLAAAGRRHGSTVVVDRCVGSAVVAGDRIGLVAGRSPPPDALVEDVRATVQIETGRDLAHDVGFGIQILVDIASLALSPAVNDPYTAVQVVDQLEIVFADLARRGLGPRAMADSGTTVAWFAAPALGDHLELATERIGRFGAAELTVTAALVRLCETTERTAATDDDRAAARAVGCAVRARAEAGAARGRSE